MPICFLMRERMKGCGFGWEGMWRESGKSWRKENHNHIYCMKTIYSQKKKNPKTNFLQFLLAYWILFDCFKEFPFLHCSFETGSHGAWAGLRLTSWEWLLTPVCLHSLGSRVTGKCSHGFQQVYPSECIERSCLSGVQSNSKYFKITKAGV